MGQVGSKRQSDPYDGYPKTKSKNTDKLKQDYSLNERINNLTNSLTGKQEISQVEAFFKKELREINASTGNESSKDIQKSLFNLKDIIHEKFNSKESHDLAFQIYCTALGLNPTFKIKELPNDVQKLIFYQYGTDIEVLEDLSDDIGSENAISAKNGWINANHISLKAAGCKNAKEAVGYIIEYNLMSANLSEFRDLVDEDLELLSVKCPYLQKLSISQRLSMHPEHLGSRSIIALKSLTHLSELSVEFCSKLPKDQFIEMLNKKPDLKSLNIGSCYQLQDPDLVEAIGKLTKLQSLNISGLKDLPGDNLVVALGKLTNLENLDVSWCKQLPKDPFIEMLNNKTGLQSLNVTMCHQLQDPKLVEVIGKMTSLHHLDVNYCSNLKEFSETLEKLTNLESLALTFHIIHPITKFEKVLNSLQSMKSLKIHGCSPFHSDYDKFHEMIDRLRPRMDIELS